MDVPCAGHKQLFGVWRLSPQQRDHYGRSLQGGPVSSYRPAASKEGYAVLDHQQHDGQYVQRVLG